MSERIAPDLLQPVRVWDLPTRVFHWLIALNLVGSIVSAKIGGNAMAWHFRLGLAALVLLGFRVVWGFVGGRWSRFASFAHGPAAIGRYLRGTPMPGERLDVGHNPLGSLSVFALLLLLVVQVATGLVADDEIATTGPLNRFVSGQVASLATGWHHGPGQWLLIALALLHVAAIAFYALRRRRNLVGPMLGGDKRLPADVPPSRDTAATRLAALAIVGVFVALAAWIESLG